jgi:putative SOS response-associated peptidase YedK
MCYKISNSADKKSIESTFGVSFKFPQLHIEQPIIDGLLESTVSIISQNHPTEVTLAIWGILPESFEDDWQHYQNVKNTLNVKIDEIKSDATFKNALRKRRCLVLVTGFFTYYLHKGILYPYYVHLPTKKPFALAGIYNELNDGFKTCSIITSSANSFIKQIHSADTFMPMALDAESQKLWISDTSDEESIFHLLDHETEMRFNAFPIAKDFHKMGVVYEGVLNPIPYANIPLLMYN